MNSQNLAQSGILNPDKTELPGKNIRLLEILRTHSSQLEAHWLCDIVRIDFILKYQEFAMLERNNCSKSFYSIHFTVLEILKSDMFPETKIRFRFNISEFLAEIELELNVSSDTHVTDPGLRRCTITCF